MTTRIHWGRVFAAAISIEVALMSLTTPVFLLLGATVFVATVPIPCLVLAFLLAFWLTRKVESRFAVHGILIGIFSTIVYFGIVFALFRSITPVVEMYGLSLFVVANGLLIAGAVLGASFASRQKAEARPN